jgi:hypothetical protein
MKPAPNAMKVSMTVRLRRSWRTTARAPTTFAAAATNAK